MSEGNQVTKQVRFLLLIIVATALVLGSVCSAYPSQAASFTPQTGDCRYFDQTGHYVCNEFLHFFDDRGGLEIFGYPITEAFKDPTHGGLRVQYFQNSRMELHPNNPTAYRVLLGLLADELGYKFPPASPEQIPATNSSRHHYFPETQHVVSYAFLDYFRSHGGIDIFGYPRSEFMYEDGYLVQYFQRARMEWRPENPPDSQIRLTNLGEQYIERFGLPGPYDEPQPPPPGPDDEPAVTPQAPVTRLNVTASVRYAITGRSGKQTVFIYVSDQRQKPVQGAAVDVTANYQTGAQYYECGSTNATGFTRCSFEIIRSPVGKRVVIGVRATHGGLTGTTQTSFTPWW